MFSYLPKDATAGQGARCLKVSRSAGCGDGLIADYREIANAATGLHDMGFAPERLAKFIGKQGAALKSRAEARRHIK